jgi:hypothetical protein
VTKYYSSYVAVPFLRKITKIEDFFTPKQSYVFFKKLFYVIIFHNHLHFKECTFRPMYLCGGSPNFFFYLNIWTTDVIPYNALNLEFANFETPCILINCVEVKLYRVILNDCSRSRPCPCYYVFAAFM